VVEGQVLSNTAWSNEHVQSMWWYTLRLKVFNLRFRVRLACVLFPCMCVCTVHWKSAHLVVVPVGDGVGLNTSFLHLKQHPYCEDWLAILPTQLQQHSVAHLGQRTPGFKRCIDNSNVYGYLIFSRFPPHLEPATCCPASFSAHRTLCAEPAPLSGRC